MMTLNIYFRAADFTWLARKASTFYGTIESIDSHHPLRVFSIVSLGFSGFILSAHR